MSLRRSFLALALTLAAASPLAAQAVPATGGGELCLIYAPIIALAVSILKRIPFLGPLVVKSPKWVAAALSAAAQILPLIGGVAVPISQLIPCVIATLGGAVLTHEALLKPAERMLMPHA